MPKLPFEYRRRETTAKLSALMLANAFIFQEQLSSLEEKVLPIRSFLQRRDFIGDTAQHWEMIIREINYVPIFKVAREILLSMPSNPDSDSAIRHLANRSLEIVSKKAALRHDLMGRIYHLLLLEAKYLGTYYTSVPAATLLLKLTLSIDRWHDKDWSDPETLKQFRIADLACGTGTLLMAASQALTDNFIKFRMSKDEQVNDESLRNLHKLIIEEMLYGYDVLPSAVHLTASTLAMLAPETCFRNMHLYSLPMGKMQTGQVYLGSIDYISADTIRTQLDLMTSGGGAEQVGKESYQSSAPLPSLDLCVMNPPFVRSVGGNLLFGSLPDERGEMQGELARRVKTSKLAASSTAGLGSVFTAVADRHLKDGGRIALVLPAALATGVAWEKTRELFRHRYVLETVVASHDPARWNFSENTDLSEIMLIARKRNGQAESDQSMASHTTQFINLWQNPKNSAHALALGEEILRGAPAPVGTSEKPVHGLSEIIIGAEKYGETLEIPWGDVRRGPWIGCSFAQTNLVRTAWMLRQSHFYRPGRNEAIEVPIQALKEIASLGPDRRDIADGFTVSNSHTPFPALIGHSGELIRTIETRPNKWLAPRTSPAKGRPARDTGLLWPRAGTVMIAERSRLNTQRALAVRLPERGLSNVWWPVRLHNEDERAEKVIAMWLNSTLGILTLVAHRVPTEGSWVQFKKPTIENLPILDVRSLSERQLTQLAGSYETLASMDLRTIPNMADDPVRKAVDEAFAKVLGLPSLDNLRAELAAEPVICNRPLGFAIATPSIEDQLQFELI
ncbi:hypothetical protein [Mesorhizobium sp. M0323]|uniref:hypothetical protein n=1 Tax=Mesorhizobium sp. M0323 TaxID=2956938 RepID=UPI00333ADB11